MKRLYYLSHNIEAVDGISTALHNAGVSDWNFHVLGRDRAGLSTHRIHSTSPLHERDIIRSGERGALIGAVLGIAIALILAIADIVPTTMMGYIGLLTLIVVFTLHGAWSGGLFGIQKENYRLRRFHNALEQDQFLVMVDVRAKHERAVRQLMSQYPDMRPVGEDATLTTPFDRSKPASL
jgi:hypothetical protein